MKSLLLQLYNGEVYPAEQYTPKTAEYRKLRQEHYNHYEDFIKQLKLLEPPLDKLLLRSWTNSWIPSHWKHQKCSLTAFAWAHE